jgi:hypothetical protein
VPTNAVVPKYISCRNRRPIYTVYKTSHSEKINNIYWCIQFHVCLLKHDEPFSCYHRRLNFTQLGI